MSINCIISVKPSTKVISKATEKPVGYIEALSYRRNRFVENYLHNTSKLVVNYLVTNNIGTVVIGKNDNWKQSANIGKINNQKFTQIPHSKLIEQITYKCQLAGIKVIETARLLYQ
ncbi:IS200/IS605 family accessory protein TnpB-related protein [Okeania sp. SIO3B5]|uniref:IS200/IS605 family accessory protein TnpB-related protein n=1 Tax=Okeania sp. SIO3B5 TaxID=2607811 RepID=UPI0025E3252A|nr:IS200/IS605 family accessory protein TnpB-related protein [Okeania sp. SIO3B5]